VGVFFLASPSKVDLLDYSVVTIALVLAAKFYCETSDVVVNSDVARVLDLRSHHPFKSCCCLTQGQNVSDLFLCDTATQNTELINRMETALCHFLRFDFYVSEHQYNQVVLEFNARIRKERLA